MNRVSITKSKNSDVYTVNNKVLGYSFLMTEDDVLRFIKAYIILKNTDAYKVSSNVLNYEPLMPEDFILRFIKAYTILKTDSSKTVVITKDDDLNYADYVTD